MTREEAKTRLVEVYGIDEPTKAQVSAYLNDRKNVEGEIRDTIVKEVKESYNGWISKEDADKLSNEIANLKDASNKASRNAKYKEKGINEKYFDFVDGKLKDSENLDEALEEFAKNYAEMVTPTQKEEVVVEKKEETGAVEFGANKGKTNAKNSRIEAMNKKFLELNPNLSEKDLM